ncbi:MAG: sulfatase [Saprospiraceae bacterium]|nr:sulfatase [Saprospiraceae bacterium]
MSDDHTSQAWGIYGGVLRHHAHTPHIRRLAAEGTVLDNAFCTNSICVPSRASILTGQYSHQNQVYTLSDSLNPLLANVGEQLRSGGYQTALFGKWHLKSRPSGFDDWQVLPGQGKYHNPVLRDSTNWQEGGKPYPGFSADVITDLSIDWLRRRDASRPFLLMTHYKATHEPFDYPHRLRNLYDSIHFPEPASLYDFAPETNGRSFEGQKLWILGNRWVDASLRNDHSRYPGLPFSLEGLDSLEQRSKIYQKFIRDFLRSGAAIDENIGRLLQYLDQQDLANNTVVIYTADQGYFLGEHGMFDKRMMYEEALRMPFVIRYPQEVKANHRLDDIVLNIDFPSLLADYGQVSLPASFAGHSFRKNLRGEKNSDWRKAMYYRYWLHRAERPAHFGIRTSQHKLMFFYGQPLHATGAMETTTTPAWEFYDLRQDPFEDRNRYQDPSHKQTIDELKQQLFHLRQDLGEKDTSAVMQAIFMSHWPESQLYE